MTAHPIELSEIPAPVPGAAPSPAIQSDAVHPLHLVKARLQVCVGDAVITVGELMNLRQHQVLPLNQTIDAPLDVLLEGKVVARGQLVAVDDHFGLRITELPLPLKV